MISAIKIYLYRHSLVDCGSSQLYLSVCLSVCVSVCPAFTAYIPLTIGRILIKLSENVGTSVRLIVFKFEHSAVKEKTTHKDNFFLHFYAFQSNSSRLRHTFVFENFEHFAAKGKTTHTGNFFFTFPIDWDTLCFLKILSILRQRETIMLPKTVTLATAILFCWTEKLVTSKSRRYSTQ